MNITNEKAYGLCRGYDVSIVLEKFFEKNGFVTVTDFLTSLNLF